MKQFIKKLIKWAVNNKVFSFPRKIFERMGMYLIQSKGGIIIYYNDTERSKVINLINKIKEEEEMCLLDNEAYQVFMAVERTQKVRGAIAEVGVYKGGSAKLICEAKGHRLLYLFDTFEGLPEVGEIDRSFHKGQFNALVDDVKNYLKKYSNVYIYKGLFNKTAGQIKDKSFSFVHLDVDLYDSTLNCLEFFYFRMNKGGIILSHDYISAAGVRKAFDEFFKDKPEPIIELSGSQCLIVKL